MSTAQILQLFGVMYLATGLGVLINPRFSLQMFRDILRQKALIYFGGFAALTIGFVLVTFYNVWQGWNILVALFGWIALVEGVLILLLPRAYFALVEAVMPQTKSGIYWTGVFALVLGAIFAYGGFIAS